MELLGRRYDYASISRKIILTFLFALATGYAAQLRIPLPWTPVPVTLQTFMVLLAGISLGSMWGGASQLLYVLCGAFGVPFFSGMEGCLSVLYGPRGGYLLGFVLTAFVVGKIFRGAEKLLLKTFISYFILIYGLGSAHLAFCIYLSTGMWPELWTVLKMGVLPFLIGDCIKILGAVWIGSIFKRVFE